MNRITTALALITFTVAGTFVQAQTEKPEIVTDRPDQTEAPVLIPRGSIQVETGFVLEKDHDQGIEHTNFAYSTTLIKYGVNDNLELRFITEYLGEKTEGKFIEESQIRGFSPLALGVKLRIADEQGIWPQTAFIGHINLRSGSQEFITDYTAADFRFTFAHSLSEKFSLSYNLGAEWNGETPEADFLYTLSLGYVITDKLGVFVESYSFFPEGGESDNRFDAGLTYKFTPVVQWDISGGVGLCDNAPDSFISTGISFRMLK